MQRVSGMILAVKLYLAVTMVLAIAAGCGGGGRANSTSISASLSLNAIQRRLAALPCPPGVSVGLWEILTTEMMSQLARRASASPLLAGPPLDEQSKVSDLNAAGDPPGSIRLRWRYRNTGDYDQNSETNISDLTPVGRHFNKTAAAADWLTAQVADGDLNTEVNISDVTPIGRCFLQTVTEYRVEFNASGAPGSEFAEFGTAGFDTGEEDPNGTLRFDATFPSAPGGYYRVVPYYNDERGIAGDPVYFAADQPPTAVLISDTQIGPSPLTVNFDASQSSDPEDGALLYFWDWEGDGVVDYESGGDATVQHEFSDLGDYAARVHVRDVAGAEDEDGLMVYCHEWEMYPVTEVFGDFGIDVIDGKPAFLYHVRESLEPGNQSLYFARSEVAVPSSAEDWALMRVIAPTKESDDTWSFPGGATDVFVLDGRPAFICYVNNIMGYSKARYLAHATTAEPVSEGDWEVTLITDNPDYYEPNIEAISVGDTVYHTVASAGPSDIVLLFRSLVPDPAGPSDWEISEICDQGAGANVSPNVSIAFIAGKLCVAVNRMDELQVDFATTSNLAPQGSEDWTYLVADTTGETLVGPETCSVSLAEIPFIVSQQDGHTHPQGIRATCALTSTPMASADWTGTTQLGDSYRIVARPVPTGSICALLAVRRFEFDPKESLALYPPKPGLAGLGAPEWVVEVVDPTVSESVSAQPDEQAEDWLYQTVPVLEGSVWKLHFARCRTKAHYTLW